MFNYLPKDLLMKLNEAVLLEGEKHAIHSQHQLESAILRPLTTVAGELQFATPYLAAACYVDSIARNHVFANGNKRTAILAAAVFFSFNGYYFIASDSELEDLVLWVVQAKPGLKQIAIKIKQFAFSHDDYGSNLRVV